VSDRLHDQAFAPLQRVVQFSCTASLSVLILSPTTTATVSIYGAHAFKLAGLGAMASFVTQKRTS
jgi:hypothetical protein